MAKSKLKAAQNSMKNRYDQNSVSRMFKPGDKVGLLALLPVQNCFLHQYNVKAL